MRLTRNISLTTPKLESAITFYTQICKMELVERKGGTAILRSGETTYHLTEGDDRKLMLEYEVADLAASREALEKSGWVRTPDGRMRDAFGTVVSLTQG